MCASCRALNIHFIVFPEDVLRGFTTVEKRGGERGANIHSIGSKDHLAINSSGLSATLSLAHERNDLFHDCLVHGERFHAMKTLFIEPETKLAVGRVLRDRYFGVGCLFF